MRTDSEMLESAEQLCDGPQSIRVRFVGEAVVVQQDLERQQQVLLRHGRPEARRSKQTLLWASELSNGPQRPQDAKMRTF